ncbi:hypothetical protein JCM10212_005127 [Sporobolomyces blumeae]
MTPPRRAVQYAHYQPPPQPIQYPPNHLAYPNVPTMSYPQAMPFDAGRFNPSIPTSDNSIPKGVGNGADFELFGPSDPLGGYGAGLDSNTPLIKLDASIGAATAMSPPFSSSSSSSNPNGGAARRASASTSTKGSGARGDDVPDLIPDQGSPTSTHSHRIDSPPSPGMLAPTATSAAAQPTAKPRRPPLSSSSFSSSGRSSSSYRSERASSVPAPEQPRPLRRKTQENLHWPSFYSSNGSSAGSGSGSTSTSSSSTGSSAYLPTPQQFAAFAPAYSDEPTSYSLPPPVSSSSSSSFDPASFSLSPAQYPYAYQAPHTDHPLLPSEQSDLLDRVRRDLLDVDLSSIKGPLRALALSGAEPSPAFSMMSPLPHGGQSYQDDRDKTPTAAYATYPLHASSASSPRRNANHRHPDHPHSTPPTRSPAVTALAHSSNATSSGTVSPKEAFLDYPAVDSKLHDLAPAENKLARSDFGVGVGHSLFAPLPTSNPSPPLQFAAGGTNAENGATRRPSSSSSSLLKTTSKHKGNSGSSIPSSLQAMNQAYGASRSPTPLASNPTKPSAAGGSLHSPSSSSSSAAAANQAQVVAPSARARPPHPFSVPQNAVTWATRRSVSGRRLVGGLVDGDPDDDDGDFGASSSTEVTGGEDDYDYYDDEARLAHVRDKAGLPSGFGSFVKGDADLERDTTMVEQERYGLDRRGERVDPSTRPVKTEDQGEYVAPGFAQGAIGGKRPSTAQGPEPGPGGDGVGLPQAAEFSFVPPAPIAHQASKSFPAQPPSSLEYPSTFAPPPPRQQQQHGSQEQGPVENSFVSPRAGSSTADRSSTVTTATSTPRRAAAAHALAGLQAQSSDSSLEGEEANRGGGGRGKRHKKRSRLAMEDEGDAQEEADNYSDRDAEGSSDEYREEDVALNRSSGTNKKEDESDASYHSSSGGPASGTASTATSSRRANNAPAPKRRRRVPAANATTSSGAKGSIACDHVSSAGERCGVVFRRPYDLARHKETIHGETLGGEKLPPGKAKEWRCEECGGTFSRKDALLRHGRIRNHKVGVAKKA